MKEVSNWRWRRLRDAPATSTVANSVGHNRMPEAERHSEKLRMIAMDIEAKKHEWQEHLQDIISRFRRISNAPMDWTVPFIPWCGDRYWCAETRILYVGKTVGCLNDNDAIDLRTRLPIWQDTMQPEPASWTRQYVAGKVASLALERPEFWLVPMLTSGAFVSPDTERSQLVHSFAWSNLYKVNIWGKCEGNGLPTQQDLACACSTGFCLHHDSAKWLIREIEILQPHLVLLGIREFWPYLAEALKLKCTRTDRLPMKLDRPAIEQLGLRFPPKGIWVTHHFTRWTGNIQHGPLLLEMRKAMKEL